MGPTPLSAVANALVLERTSLYRALAPLERDGLVELRTDPADARVKRAYLPRHGVTRIRQVMPYWQRAQESFVASVGASEWGAISKRLASLRARVAQLDTATE
jgi:DNA-binding MarR family transcriptional regulator